MILISNIGLLLLSSFFLLTEADHLPAGPLTTYWDCCKPSAAWSGLAPVSAPARSCSRDGVTTLSDGNAQSSCDGGPAFMCADYQPFQRNGINYAFAARAASKKDRANFLCACYDVHVRGRPQDRLIVQVTNEGSLVPGQFDLQVPGGGVGEFNACVQQFNTPPNGWGARYGGVPTRDQCNTLPSILQQGCYWKFDFLYVGEKPATNGADRVRCPSALTSISGCVRNDDVNFAAADVDGDES